MDWNFVALDGAQACAPRRELLVREGLRVALLQPGPAPLDLEPCGGERCLAVLTGTSIGLQAGGGTQRLGPGDAPLRLGAQVPVARLSGDGLVVDVLASPWAARLAWVGEDGLAFSAWGHALLGVLTRSAPVRVQVMERVLEVPPHHLAWCERDWAATGRVAGNGALWLAVRRG